MNTAQLDFERQWGDRPHNEAYFDGLAEREDVTFSTVEVTPTNGGKPVLVPESRITGPGLRATVQPAPELAHEPHILARFADTVARNAVAGERRIVQTIYLAATTRLLDGPVSLAIKGTSASGKSYLVKEVLAYFPTEAYYALTSGSEKAFIYSEASLVHRMLVIYEAQGMAGDMQTYLIRTLLSEGHIRHETVVKTKDGVKGKLIDRPGPTGLITTTTAIALHPENETRLLSITVSDNPEQTAAIMLAHAMHERGRPRQTDEWHALQAWLADVVLKSELGGLVDIPYAPTLAREIPPVAVRLRRDFPVLLSLISAHALLHQLNRERNEDGWVVATLEDYAIVRELVADLIGDAVGRTVSATVRATVRVVGDLTLAGGSTTILQVAGALKLDKSAGWRRVRAAIERGYVQNLQEKRGQPAQLVLGDPLPDDLEILPTVERLHGCMQSATHKAEALA